MKRITVFDWYNTLLEYNNLGLNSKVKEKYKNINPDNTVEDLVYPLDDPENTKKAIACKIVDLIPNNWYVYKWIDEFIKIVSPSFDEEKDSYHIEVITFSYEDLPWVNINFKGQDFSIKLTYDEKKNREFLDDCVSKISNMIENLKPIKRHRNFGWWIKDIDDKDLRQMNKENKNKIKSLILSNEKKMD